MKTATIDITYEELIYITTAMSYTYYDIKGIVPNADKYEQIRLKLHKQFWKNQHHD